jgi:hypothetical protein
MGGDFLCSSKILTHALCVQNSWSKVTRRKNSLMLSMTKPQVRWDLPNEFVCLHLTQILLLILISFCAISRFPGMLYFLTFSDFSSQSVFIFFFRIYSSHVLDTVSDWVTAINRLKADQPPLL